MEEYTVKINNNGSIFWFKPGTDKYHKLDGPAIEYACGDKYWYIDGKEYTEEEFNVKINPVAKELTVSELEKILGYTIKIVK